MSFFYDKNIYLFFQCFESLLANLVIKIDNENLLYIIKP